MADGDFVIRMALTPADFNDCAEVWLEGSLAGHDFVDGDFWRANREAMAEIYLPGASVWMIFLTTTNTLAGFAAVADDRLEALFIRPDFWGRGLGQRLLNHLFGLYPRLSLRVYQNNERATAFYKQFGFVVTGSNRCRHTGETELEMTRPAPLDQQKSPGHY